MGNIVMVAAVLVVANLLHRSQGVEVSFKSLDEIQAGGLYLLGLFLISLFVVAIVGRSMFGGGGGGHGH